MRNKVIGVAIWYNQAINVFWATLGFAPVSYFSYRFLPLYWLYGFLAISLGAACLPKSFFIQIQLGTTTAIYHKVGIRTVRKYTQDGSLINGMIRRQLHTYNPVRNLPVEAHVDKAWIQERFHFSAFVFLLLVSLYGLIQGNWWWTVAIAVSNLLFNVYPILLQQYNKIRFRRLLNRPTDGRAVRGI